MPTGRLQHIRYDDREMAANKLETNTKRRRRLSHKHAEHIDTEEMRQSGPVVGLSLTHPVGKHL